MIYDSQLRGGVSAPPPQILILGVGNLLLTDDGFGVHFINALKDTAFPPNITLIEAGTVSHQLIPLFREMDYIIVIDVVEAGDTPGSLFRFSPDDIKFATEQKVSLHQISLIDVLNMAELTGGKPKTVIIGVQPKDTDSWSMELSNELKTVIPKVKDLMFMELRRINAL
ncbi:MAG TPA: HyaD/HybD family hydrogenase maturation endopeptidase [Nitrospirota bacterium]|nr:HyaD/HybD family hydrogenase maturation endopeptidase [Nitrospirota bacterium]